MFTLKWILENLIAPLVVALIVGILKQIFVQIVEHIKNGILGLTCKVLRSIICKLFRKDGLLFYGNAF